MRTLGVGGVTVWRGGAGGVVMRALAALVMAAVLLAATAAPALAEATVSRVEGPDRYATMSGIVSRGFTSSGWAVVATGENYPDALSASALAGARGCPIVLTRPGALTDEAASQLRRLGVRDAYVMGGEASVSAAAEAQVGAMGIRTWRVGGADRFETSLRALEAVRDTRRASSTVVIATGYGFADALSIGPWAWATASPIVLARDGVLDDAAVDAIVSGGFGRAVIVGGEAAVSEAVRQQLAGLEVVRLEGADRYRTSASVARWVVSGGGFSWAYPAVATGAAFPDALAGSALCGSAGSPLLLASEQADGLLASVRGSVRTCTVIGGASAVSAGAMSSLCAALGAANPDPAQPGSSDDVKDQIRVIVANKSKWEYSYSSIPTAQCTVCDMDHDGRLEILAVTTGGSMRVSTSRVFEVNQDNTGLQTRFTTDDDNHGFEPDWSWSRETGTWPVTRVETYVRNGRYAHLFRDYIRDGKWGYGDITIEAILEENSIAMQNVCAYGEFTVNGTNTRAPEWHDGNGNEISQAEYDAIVPNRYAGWRAGTTTFYWIDSSEMSGDIHALLTKSWEGFRFS